MSKRIQPRNHRWDKLKTSEVLDERIIRAIERDMIRWNCSKSWIIACALAAFYDIDMLKPSELKLVKNKKIKKKVA